MSKVGGKSEKYLSSFYSRKIRLPNTLGKITSMVIDTMRLHRTECNFQMAKDKSLVLHRLGGDQSQKYAKIERHPHKHG